MFSLLQKEVYLPLLDKSNFGKVDVGWVVFSKRTVYVICTEETRGKQNTPQQRVHSLVLVRVSTTVYLKKRRKDLFWLTDPFFNKTT